MPLAPRSQSSWEGTGCEPLMSHVMSECPESHREMLYGNHVYHQVRVTKCFIPHIVFVSLFPSAADGEYYAYT
jgi:hypothetical protein